MDRVTVNRMEPAGFPTTTEYIFGNINTYYFMVTEKENICSRSIELDQPTFSYAVKTSLVRYNSKSLSSSLSLSPSPTHIPLRCAGLERVLGLRGYL